MKHPHTAALQGDPAAIRQLIAEDKLLPIRFMYLMCGDALSPDAKGPCNYEVAKSPFGEIIAKRIGEPTNVWKSYSPLSTVYVSVDTFLKSATGQLVAPV